MESNFDWKLKKRRKQRKSRTITEAEAPQRITLFQQLFSENVKRRAVSLHDSSAHLHSTPSFFYNPTSCAGRVFFSETDSVDTAADAIEIKPINHIG